MPVAVADPNDQARKSRPYMTRTIHALAPEDLDDLGRFLSVGFHLPTDSDFVLQDVLRWKYLEPRGDDDQVPRSYLARDDAGQIIGHVGICRTFFDGDAILSGRVATLHMMDWLASAEHRSVGVSLMRKIHESVPTQFVVGGTEACRAVIKRSGYIPGNALPIYQRVLRPVHWLRVPKLSIAERRGTLGQRRCANGDFTAEGDKHWCQASQGSSLWPGDRAHCLPGKGQDNLDRTRSGTAEPPAPIPTAGHVRLASRYPI